jgi:hypothetical protein
MARLSAAWLGRRRRLFGDRLGSTHLGVLVLSVVETGVDPVTFRFQAEQACSGHVDRCRLLLDGPRLA